MSQAPLSKLNKRAADPRLDAAFKGACAGRRVINTHYNTIRSPFCPKSANLALTQPHSEIKPAKGVAETPNSFPGVALKHFRASITPFPVTPLQLVWFFTPTEFSLQSFMTTAERRLKSSSESRGATKTA